MTTDDEIHPKTFMTDGCHAALTTTGWMQQSVTTNGGPGQTFIQKDAPRRQLARCEGHDHHEFERYERTVEWRRARRVGQS